MLADAMGKDAFFKDKTILLLDKDTKQSNDRTWCFWQKGEGQFDSIVHKTWPQIYFAGQRFAKTIDIAPYSYKMLRAIDFYNAHLNRIQNYPNVTFKNESVQNSKDLGGHVVVYTDSQVYQAKQVFNSIFDYRMATGQHKYPVLQQHFIGWFVKTDAPAFDEETATFMDFSIPQRGNTRFMYVLPFSKTEALVEYTLFSEKLLPKKEYEDAIVDYLQHNLKVKNYEVIDQEQGSIPMTCYDFKEHHTANIRYIGTAGGWAKPSTGYTFSSTTKKVPALVEHIKSGKPLDALSFKSKFWYYDLLLLDILKSNNSLGGPIFESIFKKRSTSLIFKMLDEETTLLEDVRFISAPKPWPFVTSLLKRLFS